MKPSHVNKVTYWTDFGKWYKMVESISSIILIPLSWKIESVREQSTRGSWVYYGTMTQNPQDWEDRLPGDLCSRQVTCMKKPAAPVSYDPWFSLWRWYDSCWIKGINMQPAWAAQKSRKKEHTPSLLSQVDIINWDQQPTLSKWDVSDC